MSAAARGAAGYLFASGRLRGVHGREVGVAEKSRKQEEAERAAADLRREREAKEKAEAEMSK
jgi:hypothetical protein